MSYTCESWLLSRKKAAYVLGTKNPRTFDDIAESYKLRSFRGRYSRASIEAIIEENFGSLREEALKRLREATGC